MEDDGHSKDSKASSDEASSAEPTQDDDAGGSSSRRAAVPYYECTFCKRGFTNAQALGGHMNIHRKDRARARQPPTMPPPSATTERAEQDPEGYGSYYSTAFYHQASEPSRSHNYTYTTTYFPPPASGARDDDGTGLQTPHELSLFGEELRLGLGSAHHVDGSVGTAGERRRREAEEDELDLELRLGHHP